MKELIARLRGSLFRVKCKFLRKNVEISEGILIYCKFKIKGPGKVKIGKDCIISKLQGDVKQYVTIDTHSPYAEINIGQNARFKAVRISSKYRIEIGNNILAEETGIVDTDFHSIHRDRGDPTNDSEERCRIIIGDNVAIGAKSIITKRAKIGNNVIMIPGSVVNSTIADNSIVGGNPAKVLKSFLTKN